MLNMFQKRVCMQIAYPYARPFASVTAAMVKELRDKTGSPMMDCKKALSDPEVDGNMDLAVDWLRKRGVAIAAKKADRTANDGLVGLTAHPSGKGVTIVEVNSETDFVARNESFQSVVADIGTVTLEKLMSEEPVSEIDITQVNKLSVGDESVSDLLIRSTATVGESLQLKRAFSLFGDVVGFYIHNLRGNSCGTQVSAVALKIEGELPEDTKPIQEFANALAMHVVGAQPLFHSSIPEEYLARERDLESERLMQEMANDKKTIDPDVAAKRVNKKVEKIIKKLTAESVLMNQQFVGLPSALAPNAKDIKGLLSEAGKSVGKIQLAGAIRVQVGVEDHVVLKPN